MLFSHFSLVLELLVRGSHILSTTAPTSGVVHGIMAGLDGGDGVPEGIYVGGVHPET